MFDATKLLGGFLQGRSPGGSSGLGSLLGGLAGGSGPALLKQAMDHFAGGTRTAGPAPAGQAASGGGFMADVAAMARRAVADPGGELRNNNPAALGGLGALAGAVMGGGRGAVGGGLLAILGSMAYRAYAEQGGTAAAAQPPAPAADAADVQRKAALVLRAMIQACKADGQLDDGEQRRLAVQLGRSHEDAEASAFLDAEMARPVDVDALAAAVRSPAEGAEIYAASVLAISVDTQAERDYLARLAAALRLPAPVVARLDQATAAAPG